MSHSYSPEIIAAEYPSRPLHAPMRSSVIGLTAFLTVVDLFAIQAILPTLAQHYKVTAAAMGFAVNASTMGMAIGALLVGVASEKIDRRMGILISLALLSLPTALLASAPNLAVFTLLRVLQGVCMSAAFALTLAYLGEDCSMAPFDTLSGRATMMAQAQHHWPHFEHICATPIFARHSCAASVFFSHSLEPLPT